MSDAAQLPGEFVQGSRPIDLIVRFNDDPETTLADVHAVLDRAIEAETE